MNGNFIWFVSDQKEFKYQLSSSLDMMLLDFPIICKKKEYDRKRWKRTTPPKTNKPMLPKARIYFYNQKDGAEMKTLEA